MTLSKQIILIDDETRIQNFIGISLNAEGYRYRAFSDAATGLNAIESEHPDLVILDLGLPDLDGFEVLRRIRVNSKVPVLILTARDEENEKVRLLEAGANDYLSKPFGIKELIVRIKVLIRDIGYSPLPDILGYGDMQLATQERQVTIQGEVIQLTKKEHALLMLLAAAPGQLVLYESLLTHIWGHSHKDDTHYLRVLVNQLRKKINDDIDSPKYIKTEPGVGYRFIAKMDGEIDG